MGVPVERGQYIWIVMCEIRQRTFLQVVFVKRKFCEPEMGVIAEKVV